MSDISVKGIRLSDGRKVQLLLADDPKKSDGSDLLGNDLGAANGIASLDASSLVVQLPANLASPRWVKYTVLAAAFTAASATEDVELFSLVAGGIIQGVKIKHITPFTGGTLSAFTLSVGIVGNLNKYASAFDVFQAAADNTFQISNLIASEDHGSVTSIRVEATATDDTVDNATAGTAEIWVLTSAAV